MGPMDTGRILDNTLLHLQRGGTPLLISLPHAGTAIPGDLAADFAAGAEQRADTDWHLERLYDFAGELGASVLRAKVSRYVVDCNRPPEDTPLYPGANNTGLCPTTTFAGEALYRPGRAPGPEEIARRRASYWQPYHDALRAELDRLKTEHGRALLLDGHSIRSQLPWLFAGKLPDLNLGTADGSSCAPDLRAELAAVLGAATHYSHVLDGRFKGGYITRHYGRPHEKVHAVQLEMCWSCYMVEEPPYTLDEGRAVHLRPVLRALAAVMIAWSARHA